MINIIILLVSLIPSVLIFIWLRNRHKNEPMYKKSCNSAFIRGFVSVFPVILMSGILFLINLLIKTFLIKDMNILIYKAIYCIIVLALVEEMVKFFMFRLLIKKKLYTYSWADIVALMVIIGLSFGLFEDLPYAIGADAITMIVRGLTMGHIGYGFIMGWFFGKSLYTGKKRYAVFSIIIPWLIHGLYDYSLSEELLALNDIFYILPLALALSEIVLIIITIVFFIRTHKKERYCVTLKDFERTAIEEIPNTAE